MLAAHITDVFNNCGSLVNDKIIPFFLREADFAQNWHSNFIRELYHESDTEEI